MFVFPERSAIFLSSQIQYGFVPLYYNPCLWLENLDESKTNSKVK